MDVFFEAFAASRNIKMKDKLFGIFLSIYLFWEPIVYCTLGARGGELNGSIMRLSLVAIFSVSWFLYFCYKKTKADKRMFGYLVLVGVLYLITGFFFDDKYGMSSTYNGYFLRWGADCISACVLGLLFTKVSDYKYLHFSLPIVTCALTPLMLKELIASQIFATVMESDSGFNYQNIAYHFAVMYAISAYYLFINQNLRQSRFRLVLFAFLLVQGVACAMSGGRGGFVLLLVYTLYILYLMLKRGIISKKRLLLIMSFGAVCFMFIADKLGLFDSVGFSRAKELSLDEARQDLYKNTLSWILTNPITGFGLGSVWFTTGFYNHNIFLDLLVETGLIGLIIMIRVLRTTYNRILKLTRFNDAYYIILFVFIYGCVMNLVTGYWIATYSHWMAFGCAISFKLVYCNIDN